MPPRPSPNATPRPPADTAYPPSLREARAAEDLAALDLLIWWYDHKAKALPEHVAKVAGQFEDVGKKAAAFDAANDHCLAYVAPHDRAAERAADADGVLIDLARMYAAVLEADGGALHQAPFALIPLDPTRRAPPRDVQGLMSLPHFELLLAFGDITERLPAPKRTGRVAEISRRITLAIPLARAARTEERNCAQPAENALALRAETRRELVAAIKTLVTDATALGIWSEMEPAGRKQPLNAIVLGWINGLADWRPFKRRVVSPSLRRTLLAAALLVPLLFVAKASWHRHTGNVAQPIAAVTTPAPTPVVPSTAKVDPIFGTVTNLDDRPWRVLSDCSGSNGGKDSMTFPKAGTADASGGLRLGYLPRDRTDAFVCTTVLEGGSSSCVLGKKATCSIKDGRLFNNPLP